MQSNKIQWHKKKFYLQFIMLPCMLLDKRFGTTTVASRAAVMRNKLS